MHSCLLLLSRKDDHFEVTWRVQGRIIEHGRAILGDARAMPACRIDAMFDVLTKGFHVQPRMIATGDEHTFGLHQPCRHVSQFSILMLGSPAFAFVAGK